MATLRGKVSDPRQKARASQIVSAVSGVQKVDNRLVVVARSEGPIRQVTATDADVASPAQQASAQQPSGQPTQMSANQEKAMQVGHALQEAGLNGYDIEIMFQNGRCVLQGVVGTMEQRNGAAQVAESVPGVQAVSNQLRVQGQAGPMGAQPGPYGAQGSSLSVVRPSPYQMAAGPGSSGWGSGWTSGPGCRGQCRDPFLRWVPRFRRRVRVRSRAVRPTTTRICRNTAGRRMPSIPNYAAVTYPSQYSASAWPYIGPFYPYPQVPLNWRKVTLEWSDGHWDLNFDSRTDRWWWFLNPKNW